MTRWKPYVAPGALAVLAVTIYVWPIKADNKAPTTPNRYRGAEHEMRRVGTSAEPPAIRIALADPVQTTETSSSAPILVGISGGVAWFKVESSGEFTAARVGSDIEGWTVTSVSSRRVVIKSGSRTEALALF